MAFLVLAETKAPKAFEDTEMPSKNLYLPRRSCRGLTLRAYSTSNPPFSVPILSGSKETNSSMSRSVPTSNGYEVPDKGVAFQF